MMLCGALCLRTGALEIFVTILIIIIMFSVNSTNSIMGLYVYGQVH